MGSGLILLGIAGAWLAVLVPMALRSHDSAKAMSSADRFSDAMRVLSRREQQGRGGARSVVVPRAAASRQPVPLAVRRLRVLLVLSGLAGFTLLLVVLGFGWALVPHVVIDLLALAYVAHLRSQAIRKAERSIRSAARPRPAAPMRIAGIPDRMPERPTASVAAPAARYVEPQPGALGQTWTAQPVPVPTYVTAPMAPPRTYDLTVPGAWSAQVEIDAVDAAVRGSDDEVGDELDEILEPRRASGDW